MPGAPKTSLERLLRLRHLEEDLAMQALAACNLTVRRLQQRAGEIALWRKNLATEGIQALTAGESALWQAGETEKHWSRSLAEQLREEIESARLRMLEERERMLTKRSARMAVETLVEESRQRERYERDRREQQSLDEWFQIVGGKSRPDRLPIEPDIVDSNSEE
jgi:flagellar export protein FliJ